MPNENSSIQFKAGLYEDYIAISNKDTNTIYFCTDTQQMFVGDTEYTRPVLVGTELPDIKSPIYTLFYNTSTKILYTNLNGTWIPLLVGEVITNDDIDEICGDILEGSEYVSVSNLIDEHNTNGEAHSDIRSELTDIRNASDGTVYDSAGNAVRTQISDIKNDLADLNDKVFYFESHKDKIKLTALSIETAKCIYSSGYTNLIEQTNSAVWIYDNLVEGDTLFVSSTVMNKGYTWGFSFTNDRNKTIYHYIDDTVPSLTDKTDIKIIVPTGATKLYVSRLTSKGDPEVYKKVEYTIKTPKFVSDVLYRKKLLVFGDSMAYGHTIPDKVWVKLLADKYNMTLTNKAQNGTTIVRKTTTISGSEFLDTDSVYAKVMDNLNNPVEADYVVVFGGTNDIARNDQCPLGTIDDTSSQTFYGALNAICQRLIQTYPTGCICFITPYIRNAGLATTEISKQYVKAIHNVCEKWGGIPVFDNTVNGALDFSNSYQVNALTMQDSYHLNENGHKRAMHKYEVFLQSL